MTDTMQYYLNKLESPNCPQIPTKYDNYLVKNNHLSEFVTELDKESARENLGIPDIINEINNKIDAKVIESGNLAWDLIPTEGNIEHILSSDAIYKALLKYALKTEINDLIQTIWTNVINKIGENRTEIQNAISEVYQDLQQQIENLANNPNSFERRLVDLEHKVDTFLRSSRNGTALSNEFGGDEYVGINQKTLTESINRIWEKISELSGEGYNGIIMSVDPEYFIGENGCDIHVTATTERTNGIFEYIKLYINGEQVYEQNNVEYLEYDIHIDETSVLTCKAKILGIEYSLTKTIVHYSSFWIGSGTSYEDVMNTEHLVSITNGMKGSHDIYFNEGDKLFIIVGNSLREGFYRADMNGMEIPFAEDEITLGENTYKVFTSNNTYHSGTYNIDINS